MLSVLLLFNECSEYKPNMLCDGREATVVLGHYPESFLE
jgi:hypothetical protein